MGKIELTTEMKAYLRLNYDHQTNAQLAKALGLKLTKCREFLYSLGLQRMKLEYWTDEQIKFLVDNYQMLGDTEIADLFNNQYQKEKGWSKKHIEKKRRQLKLKRTKEQIANIREDWRLKGLYKESNRKMWLTRGVSTEGTIRYQNLGGRSIPMVKVDGKFIHYARHRWIELHGDIQTGMNVCFIDNNPQNMADDNLYLRSDAELALINSASILLTDNYVAGMLTHGKSDLRNIIKKHPGIIAAKRAQLLLQREINNQLKK